MAGNSRRQGARRTEGSKKGPVVGSGGKRARGLEGRGPTPKATERPGHPASRRVSPSPRRDAPTRGRDGGGRPKAGTEVIAGRNAVLEALRGGVPVTAVYVADRVDADERVREVLALVGRANLPLLEVTRGELDRLTDSAVHQGLAVTVPAYSYAHPDDLPAAAQAAGEPALLVALDGVTDPRNLGAVVRSAAAFGAHGVVVPARRAAGMTAGAWKASAGAATVLPVARATNLARTLEDYRGVGLTVVGLAGAEGTALDMLGEGADPVAATGLVLVVGSEGQGLSRLVARACDWLVTIPTSGRVESLNASVAASVALYAVARTRAAR